jgi:hypothetical protein
MPTCVSRMCVCSAPAALNLPQWLNLSTARSMLLQRLMGHVAVSSLDAEEADKLRRQVGWMGVLCCSAVKHSGVSESGMH